MQVLQLIRQNHQKRRVPVSPVAVTSCNPQTVPGSVWARVRGPAPVLDTRRASRGSDATLSRPQFAAVPPPEWCFPLLARCLGFCWLWLPGVGRGGWGLDRWSGLVGRGAEKGSQGRGVIVFLFLPWTREATTPLPPPHPLLPPHPTPFPLSEGIPVCTFCAETAQPDIAGRDGDIASTSCQSPASRSNASRARSTDDPPSACRAWHLPAMGWRGGGVEDREICAARISFFLLSCTDTATSFHAALQRTAAAQQQQQATCRVMPGLQACELGSSRRAGTRPWPPIGFLCLGTLPAGRARWNDAGEKLLPFLPAWVFSRTHHSRCYQGSPWSDGVTEWHSHVSAPPPSAAPLDSAPRHPPSPSPLHPGPASPP